MRLTKEMLAQGASDRGGFSRKQLALLGVDWPPASGWKNAVSGRDISDEAFTEFVQLAKRTPVGAGSQRGVQQAPVAVGRDRRPQAGRLAVLHIYVLALENGCFYVGMTDNFDRRYRQHCSGIGAEWTALHRPFRALHCVCTGTTDRSQGARMEDAATLELMLQHGADRVRGGQYAFASQELVDASLRSHGHWYKFRRRELDQQAFGSEASWSEALDNFLSVALAYYEAGAPADRHDAVFTACYRLTRYRYWREEFAPGLSWNFWSSKGVLPVLLTFKHGRVIGSRSSSPYEVLAAALTRGRRNERTLQRLFLIAWKGYLPPTTPNQSVSTDRFMQYLEQRGVFDSQYDEFVSVLLPELRHSLRQPPLHSAAKQK